MKRSVGILALCVLLFNSAANASEPTVKKSRSGICHSQSSQWFERTQNYKSFNSIEACINSGGRLPKTQSHSRSDARVVAVDNHANTYKRYDRSHFSDGWEDYSGNCRNTRHELLAQQSITKVSYSSNGCYVQHGKWHDPYTDKVFTSSRDLDIDHIVPLYFAWENGASEWSESKREAFSQDPMNLIAVDNGTNREKGARGPLEWLPPNEKYHCQYVTRFLRGLIKYEFKEQLIAKHRSFQNSICGR